jgi:hypothetical protein
LKNGFQKIPHYRESWAIVIGINKYANPDEIPLENAVNDAVALGNLLRDIGFEVRELYDENATKEKIISLLTDELINEVEYADRIIIFFAGHAITRENKGDKSYSGYIMPYDGTSSKISSLIEFDDLVRKTAKHLAAIHILFMLDCCFSGIAAAPVMRSSREDSLPLMPSDKYIDLWMKKRALQIITAGEEDQAIPDESIFFKGHSVFTGAILDGIKSWKADLNKDGVLTASELGEYLKRVVPSIAYHQHKIQKPYVNSLSGHENGEFIIAFSDKPPNASFGDTRKHMGALSSKDQIELIRNETGCMIRYLVNSKDSVVVSYPALNLDNVGLLQHEVILLMYTIGRMFDPLVKYVIIIDYPMRIQSFSQTLLNVEVSSKILQKFISDKIPLSELWASMRLFRNIRHHDAVVNQGIKFDLMINDK